MNQSALLSKIKDEIKEVQLAMSQSKQSNGYECFNMYVITHLENLQDEINEAFKELKKEILIRR